MEEAEKEAERQLACDEAEVENALKIKNETEIEVTALKKKFAELEFTIKKAESEKQVKDNQIRSLKNEQQHQDATLDKLEREKTHQEEVIKFKIKKNLAFY